MFYQRLVLCFSLLLLISCGGQGSYSGPASGTFVVNVTVSGLPSNGSRVDVQNNGASTLSFVSNGTQTFPSQAMGSAYSVSISKQPSPLYCSVTSTTGSNPVNVSVTCSDQYVYITNSATNTLSRLSVGAGGLMTQVELVSTGQNPTSVVIHPNGKYVYVANYSNSTINFYSLLNGSLSGGYVTSLDPNYNDNNNININQTYGPNYLTITPNGSYLYCVNRNNGTISEYQISSSGVLTSIGSTFVSPGINSMAIDPSGSYVYVSGGPSSSTLYEYQIQSNGTLLPLRPEPLNEIHDHISGPTAVHVSPGGKFAYVVNSNSTSNSVAVYSIGAGGTLAYSTNITTGSVPHDIAFSPSGAYAYVSNYGGSGTISQYTVNPSSGALTPMTSPSVPAGSGPYSVVVDPSGYGVFSSNYNSNSISQFIISGTGSLPDVASHTFNTNIGDPTSIAIH